MATSSRCECTKTAWKGRSGWRLSNGLVELIVLNGGGHLASLRRLQPESPNLLWEAPWKTIDPARFRSQLHAKLYTPPPSGPFLSGFTGHALVVGYFGGPSDAEAASGLPIHGEAASRSWRAVRHTAAAGIATLVMEVREPAMGLRVRRELAIYAGESVVHIGEQVANERSADTYFQWVQHATFGEPLLVQEFATVTVPAVRACTWPLGYEGKALLADNKGFHWPNGPLKSGGTADLSRGFIREGTGFVAAAQIDVARTHGFVSVANTRLRLAAGYFFQRERFPWVTVWEENQAREYSPWNGVTRARGLEFGTSPFPLGLADAVSHGPMFDTPTVARVGAKQTISVNYELFAAAMPEGWRAVSDVRLSDAGLELIGAGGREAVRLGAAPRSHGKGK